MTANPRRRRKRHVVGLLATAALMIVAAVLVAVAVGTLRNSREGQAVGLDERPVIGLPATPNALAAVEGDEGELTSLVVLTLLPAGQGGTIVTVPVNADVNAGVSDELLPLTTAFEELDFDEFVARVEGMLALTIERSALLDEQQLEALVEPVAPVDVVLPDDVVDADAPGTGVVEEAGEQELTAQAVAEVLVATDETGEAYDHHDLDVAVWNALAAQAPVSTGSAPELQRRADGDPVPPADVDELVQRLWDGPVQVRDLQLAEDVPASGDDDVVVVDRRDSLLVLAQISPALVSTPNPALSFRLEIGFTDEQLAEHGDDLETNSDVGRQLIGEILFFQGNVVSVDLVERTSGGAGSVTRIAVAEEQFLDDLVEFAPLLFGEVEVELASTLIEGIDVVVTLGTGYLQHEIPPDGGADQDADAPGEDAPDAPAGTDASTSADTGGGTVESDE